MCNASAHQHQPHDVQYDRWGVLDFGDEHQQYPDRGIFGAIALGTHPLQQYFVTSIPDRDQVFAAIPDDAHGQSDENKCGEARVKDVIVRDMVYSSE